MKATNTHRALAGSHHCPGFVLVACQKVINDLGLGVDFPGYYVLLLQYSQLTKSQLSVYVSEK